LGKKFILSRYQFLKIYNEKLACAADFERELNRRANMALKVAFLQLYPCAIESRLGAS